MPGRHSLTPLGWRDLWPPMVHLDLQPAEAREASLTRADPGLVGHPCPESHKSDRFSPHVGYCLEGPFFFPVLFLFFSLFCPSRFTSPLILIPALPSFFIWKTCPCLQVFVIGIFVLRRFVCPAALLMWARWRT